MGRDGLRRLLPALPLLLAACDAQPAGSELEKITARLDRCLTPALAERDLGAPDEVTGSGLLIYGYRLADGGIVWLSFPGRAPIVTAHLWDAGGRRSELPLRDC